MADTITLRTSTERDVVKIVERGPQGPAGGGGGGGSGTVTSVALAGTGLSITGSPVTASGTITANVSYGTTAGTACEGNDGRIAGIQSGSISIDGASFGAGDAGFGITTGNGTGQINTVEGGSIYTSEDGGSIDTRGTGYIEFGELGTRTTLTGTATADRVISLPDAAGTVALTSDITKTAVGLGNVTNNAQTQAAIVPNTAPSAGQLLVGNAGGTAYAPASVSGDATLSSAGALTLANNSTARSNLGLGNSATLNTGTTAGTVATGDHTHSQLHDRSHAITSTSDHTATANRVFYSNSSGQVTELALGAANTVLTSNGTTSAPSFAAVSAGATNLWIPASAWIPRTTTGCGVDSTELSTNKVNTDQLLFDAATEEYAQALVMMPSNYNYGTITARFYWTASSGSGGVAFGLRGRAYADDDALDQAQGTGQVTTDTFIVADDLHVTAATSAITLAGTPAANRPVQFEIYRQVSNASDTLGVDARLLGVEIIFN